MTTTPTHTFDLSPEEFRRISALVTEVMAAALEAERSDPVHRLPRGAELRDQLDEPLPSEAAAPDAVISVWENDVLPHCRRNGHPRFFGYVCTSADPWGMFADAVASSFNQPVAAWRSSPAATELERLVVRWLDELVGFQGTGGVMTSGGSAANFHALACAVTRAERTAPGGAAARPHMTMYLSSEGHVSLRKAARLLGFLPDHIRTVPVDRARRMESAALDALLREDLEKGLVPVAVTASAGTANTGAIDPLKDLATVCEQHGVWLHIDGSYGAPAAVTPGYAWMRSVFARADSMSLDPHKWLFAPADAGCVLIRDEDVGRETFTLASEYTTVTQTDPIERYALFDHGLEMSRRFRSLKVWSILKARGLDQIREVIARNIRQREHLDRRIAAHPRLESLGSELSISCFRFVPDGDADLETVNHVNQTILETLVDEGRCYMSPTTLDGRYALRVCIVNFRTQMSDIDFLVDEVLRVGEARTAAGGREG